MATATVEIERKYTLVLSRYEANWLRQLCQNYIPKQDLALPEGIIEKKIRESIYNALANPDQLPEPSQ